MKYDWYQTEATVVITILVKNVQSTDSQLEFNDTTLNVSLKLPNEEFHVRELHLAYEIVPQECSYRISPTKVSLTERLAEVHMFVAG